MMLWEVDGRETEDAEPKEVYARVALAVPVRQEFSYRVRPGQALREGCRVEVPLGRRRLLGVVVGLDRRAPDGLDPGKLRPVLRVLDAEPLLTAGLLRLGRHIADRAYCSWGLALAAMLPAALRHGRRRRAVRVVSLVRAPTTEERALLADRFPKQERALAWLEAAGGPVPLRDFLARTGLSASPVESLARRGLAALGWQRPATELAGARPVLPDTPPEATPAQQAAVAAVLSAVESERNDAFLLHGVTGSGKTEIYLRVLEQVLARGRGAIVLVPEISLTPQTVARFRARCGDVAVLHSGLTDAERHDQWVAIRQRRLRVVVGARSALFAPVEGLGLVVVDEEHESSFKQESTPRYHAREVALERARLEGAVCILGSATPALETWQRARHGELRLLELPDRVAGGRLPEVELVDMRVQPRDSGHWMVVSEPLRRALAVALERGERAILFLNQRGFAPAWHCRACGSSVHCPRCDVSLTWHRWRRRAICHYCLEEQPPPQACPSCGKPVTLVGVGTERAEDTVRRLFPDARLARMDRDTMVRRESYEQVLDDFGAGRVDVLLGTQMVAKGLDFPEVTLVGVLNADVALHHPDFRAAERCFNLVAQVAGRAGRGERRGRVVVQTWCPEHPALQAAVRHDYAGFALGELEERRLFGYPPFRRVLRIMIEAADGRRVEERARSAAARIQEAVAASGEGVVQALGPAPPPVERLRGRWRRQILVKTPVAGRLDAVEKALQDLCQRDGVVVDPL